MFAALTSDDSILEGPVEPEQAFPSWPAIFGVERPLHCEIGSGRGHFALDFAAANDVNVIAIEQRRSDCDDMRRRRAQRKLTNLEVIHGDARLLLPRFFREGEVASFHIHCPDPWWKNRHHRRRLIADDFGLMLWRLLRVGGELDLRTDVPAYATAMVETCEEIIGYENVYGPGEHRPADGLILSTRERRYAITGQPMFRYLYRRTPGLPRTEESERAWVRREWTDVRRK
jgi:tRNA (guanine-N7-)-methyltransferase